MTDGTLHINVDVEGLSETQSAAAVEAAEQVEVWLQRGPELLLGTIAVAREGLENPVAASGRKIIDSLGLDPQRHAVATHVANLLNTTEHGKLFYYGDDTYSILDNDQGHTKLIDELHRSRSNGSDSDNLRLNTKRRQVAINGLAVLARLTTTDQQQEAS